MSDFNNHRLRSARLLAGLSMRQLADLLIQRVTYNSINKYEKGQMTPDNGTIIKLAQVLQVPAGYFFEEDTIDFGDISFRKKSGLTDGEILWLKEKTKDKLERYIEVENLLNISSTFHNPIARIQVNNVEKAEEMAEVFRHEWSLGTKPISNIIEVLEENQVKVIEMEASEQFDGLSTIVNKKVPVTVINSIFPSDRKRLTAIHELGHLSMRFATTDHFEKENYCNRFAAAFLFPKEEVIKALGAKRSMVAMAELINLKEEFGISVQAIMKRALDLNIITAANYKRFCIKIAGNKKEERLGVYAGIEKSTRFTQLVLRVVAEEIITLEKGAALLGITSTELHSILNNATSEDSSEQYSVEGTSFMKAWEGDTVDYDLSDLKTINPFYAGR